MRKTSEKIVGMKVYRFKIVRMVLLLLLGAPAFVAASVWLLVNQTDKWAVWGISGAGILFFGGVFVMGITNVPHLIRNNEALILTPHGLTLFHAGKRRKTFIAWDEITGFTETWIKGNLFIAVHLRKPRREIDRERSRWYRMLMNLNLRQTGTPYHIAPSTIHCNSGELIATLVDYLERYGRSAPSAPGEK